jgi:hypothetical protein
MIVKKKRCKQSVQIKTSKTLIVFRHFFLLPLRSFLISKTNNFLSKSLTPETAEKLQTGLNHEIMDFILRSCLNGKKLSLII